MTRSTQTLTLSALALLFAAQNASAVTMTIGDVDGFGFTNPNDYNNAQGGDPDTNGNGIIEAGEFLPDLDNDGYVRINGNDEFDNRSTAEENSTVGAQWTDIALENNYNGFGASPADDALFTFNFIAPTAGDSDYGVDHFINFIFGDYDVGAAKLYVDGTEVNLTTQAGNEDGLVQLAYADVAWSDMIDGQVVIDMYAPSEPYVTIDYAFLHTEATAAPLQTSVPEPSMIALMAAGLLGFGVLRRRV